MWYGENRRVTLLEDLTRYHSHLIQGATGTLLKGVKAGEWGWQDRFGAVRFDCCGVVLDILLKGLDIEGAEEGERDREAQFREDLKTTTKAVLTVGPRGGFRSLSITYNRGNLGTGFRDKGLRVAAILREHGIEVERRVERE